MWGDGNIIRCIHRDVGYNSWILMANEWNGKGTLVEHEWNRNGILMEWHISWILRQSWSNEMEYCSNMIGIYWGINWLLIQYEQNPNGMEYWSNMIGILINYWWTMIGLWMERNIYGTLLDTSSNMTGWEIPKLNLMFLSFEVSHCGSTCLFCQTRSYLNARGCKCWSCASTIHIIHDATWPWCRTHWVRGAAPENLSPHFVPTPPRLFPRAERPGAA